MSKIYKDLDEFPLKTFAKIAKTGDISLICYEGKASANELIEAWDVINRQFFELSGMKDAQRALISAKVAYIKHISDYYVHGKKFSKTLAALEERKIEMFERLEAGNGNVDFMKLTVAISKALEMRLDYNSLMVSEFFHYMNMAEQISKAMEKSAKK